MGDNNKIKKISLVSLYVLGSLYLLFLLLPLVLSPILNSYSVQIESALEEATGYKFKLEKLWVVTTPKLTAGVKAANVSLFTPDGQKFLELNNCRANLSLLPLLLRKIEADLLYCQNKYFLILMLVHKEIVYFANLKQLLKNLNLYYLLL